ncbi:FFAR3 protein, partial [Atractosteus spatula]|nr:FFAR3 protein [Atractosteus spatula]
ALGYQPPLFPDSPPDTEVPSVQEYITNLQEFWKKAKAALLHTAARQKTAADRRRRTVPRFRRGQFVWLSTHNLPLKQPSGKLAPRFIGPFRVLTQVTPVTYRLALPPTLRIHPTFHVSLLKPFRRSTLSKPQTQAILCFLPYNISHVVGYIKGYSPSWRTYALLLSTFNTCLNPIIFYFSSSAFQETFRKYFKKIQGKKPVSQSSLPSGSHPPPLKGSLPKDGD